MATLQQCQDAHLDKGLLPPLRELFLEIQVNKLINDYLFSSTAEEIPSSLHVDGNGSLESKENNALSLLPAMSHTSHNMVALSAYNVPSRPVYQRWMLPSHELHHLPTLTRASSGLYMHESGETDKNTKVKEEMVPYSAQSSNAICEVSSVALSIENEGGKTACLSRVDTFPCASKVELQVGVPLKADMEIKVTSKKPPRPPKLPNLHSNNLGPSLTRCFSDTGTLSLSSRRAKLEKRRKAASSPSANTSLWALLFTFCFALIMIGQGFWSQGSQDLATLSTNASSPVEEYMRTSRLVVQDGVAEGRHADGSKGVLSDITMQLDLGT